MMRDDHLELVEREHLCSSMLNMALGVAGGVLAVEWAIAGSLVTAAALGLSRLRRSAPRRRPPADSVARHRGSDPSDHGQVVAA